MKRFMLFIFGAAILAFATMGVAKLSNTPNLFVASAVIGSVVIILAVVGAVGWIVTKDGANPLTAMGVIMLLAVGWLGAQYVHQQAHFAWYGLGHERCVVPLLLSHYVGEEIGTMVQRGATDSKELGADQTLFVTFDNAKHAPTAFYRMQPPFSSYPAVGSKVRAPRWEHIEDNRYGNFAPATLFEAVSN